MGNRDAGQLDAELPILARLIAGVIDANAGRHPGIISEAIVERIATTYEMLPRERHHREQRKNHRERIRRLSHETYRSSESAPDLDPAREIATRLSKSFILTRLPAGRTSGASRP